MPRDNYTYELADTVNTLFGREVDPVTDPSAEEIAKAHFTRDGFEPSLGGEIVDGVRKRLSRLITILEADFGHQVCLLNTRYYISTNQRRGGFRRKPPATKAEARTCLPLGQGVLGQGIWLSRGVDDLIYQESLTVHLNNGVARVRNSRRRVMNGISAGHIPPLSGEGLFKVLRDEAKLLPEPFEEPAEDLFTAANGDASPGEGAA